MYVPHTPTGGKFKICHDFIFDFTDFKTLLIKRSEPVPVKW